MIDREEIIGGCSYPRQVAVWPDELEALEKENECLRKERSYLLKKSTQMIQERDKHGRIRDSLSTLGKETKG